MLREDSIFAEGVVTGVRSDRVCELRLENGHEMIGYVTQKDSVLKKSIDTGMKVTVRCSPFDLSKGQVVF